MSLKETINADMKSAMRSKDSVRLDAIRMLRAAVQRIEVDEKRDLDDDGVIAVTEKLIKQSKDAMTQFAKGQRDDLVAKEQSAVDVWQTYLPKQLDDVEIERLIADALAASGASSMRDMGKVMGILKPQLQGRADMAAVSTTVKARLSGK
jgi:uncharacterized protein YqeY